MVKKKSFRNLASGTSIHGFAELYYAKSTFWIVIWALVLAGAFSVTSYQAYGVIQSFLDQPTSTVILPAKEEEILYPPLRVCYLNWMFWIDWDKAIKSMNISKETIFFGLNYMNVIYASETFDLNEAESNFAQVMKENNFTKIFQFYKAIARVVPITADNNLTLYFDKVEIIHKEPSTLFCYTMSEPQVFKYFKDNLNNTNEKWITFTTPDETYELVKDYVTIDEYNRYSKRWIQIKSMYKILPEYEAENFTEFAPPILVFPNAYNKKSVDMFTENDAYMVSLQASARTMKNRSKVPCVEGVQSTQSNDTCLSKCLAVKVNSSCSCMSVESAVILNEDLPENLCHKGITFMTKQGDRTASFKYETYLNQDCFDTNEAAAEFEKCKYDCIPACTIFTYDTSVSIIKMTTFVRRIGKKDSTNISVEYPKGDRIIVMTEVNAQTWENFVGSVGGILGIWTGASVLSFLQCFYLICCADHDELRLKGMFPKRQIHKINVAL